jgi:hypothetical protein
MNGDWGTYNLSEFFIRVDDCNCHDFDVVRGIGREGRKFSFDRNLISSHILKSRVYRGYQKGTTMGATARGQPKNTQKAHD